MMDFNERVIPGITANFQYKLVIFNIIRKYI